MFVYSVKANTLKLIGCILAAAIILTALVIFIPNDEAIAVSAGDGKVVYTNAKDNDGRINFLSQFGYSVKPTPIDEVTVTLPSEFDTVFAGYNELQKLQGLDLSRYKRKEVVRYTYEVTNYEGYEGKVLANLLIYRGRVIGGDICTESAEGFIHEFLKTTHL